MPATGNTTHIMPRQSHETGQTSAHTAGADHKYFHFSTCLSRIIFLSEGKFTTFALLVARRNEVFATFAAYGPSGRKPGQHNAMKKILLLFLLLCLTAHEAAGQRTDTLEVFSPSMGRHVKNLVITPKGYERTDRLPVVYLLHGHGDTFRSWQDFMPDLPQQASRHGFIIVCPDGSDSWYWDWPGRKDMQYETYMTRELIPAVDSCYKTRAHRSGRAVTGLSMGGHGALWLALRHQDLFGACGSTSGGVDLRPFPDSWNLKQILGERDSHAELWQSHCVVSQLDSIRPGLALIIDCGTEDFFAGVNEALHRELARRNIPHDYIVRPGAHKRPYWRRSLPHHFLFFTDFFSRAKH